MWAILELQFLLILSILASVLSAALKMCTRTPILPISTGARECQSGDKIQPWQLLGSIIPDKLNDQVSSHCHHLSVHLEAKGVEADQNLSHPGSWCHQTRRGGGLAARQIVLARRLLLPPSQTGSYWRRACPAPAAASESPSSAAGARLARG